MYVMMSYTCILLYMSLSVLAFKSSVASRTKYLTSYPDSICSRKNYLCKNGKCIQKSWYCDGGNDCGDNSDEEYCGYNSDCPSHYPFMFCDNNKCIPQVWKCDGKTDCSNGRDEAGCSSGLLLLSDLNSTRADSWFVQQANEKSPTNKWGSSASRIAVALYFANSKYFSGKDETGNSLTYEVQQRLLEDIIREGMNIDALSPNALAHYLNALTVGCVNVRDIRGIDLVAKLSKKMDEMTNFVAPFPLLSLCIAGHNLSSDQIHQLRTLYQKGTTRTDKLAYALMALSCVVDGRYSDDVSLAELRRIAAKLKATQHADGSFENVATTALVLQALIASEETDGTAFTIAVRYLQKEQSISGSFGSLINTYYAVPVLKYKSFLDLNTDHCRKRNGDNENSFEDLSHQRSFINQYVHVTYSTCIGDQFNVVNTLTLRVPVNSTFLDIMKAAAALDQKYRFEFSIRSSKPYIYEIGGIQDDVESERYWFLFNGNQTNFNAIYSSPADVVVRENGNFMMWYRAEETMSVQNSTTPKLNEPEMTETALPHKLNEPEMKQTTVP